MGKSVILKSYSWKENIFYAISFCYYWKIYDRAQFMEKHPDDVKKDFILAKNWTFFLTTI